ncbi:hypothetical protein [Mucilaginibacter sp.]|uniref:hypothetical protein n=1 Tax=Mucilaginibacter sp. TaxID=1882438 RepID=UPI00263500B7|nr:hypothetical protein [Mucilaginibacter sp.]MDB5127274.1 hypothetical protein [Mucilaginibacter sp.]
MKRTYHISLNIKTPDGGFEAYGRYELGSDKAFARMLFEQLKGDEGVFERSVLHMDLTEVENGIPFVQAVRHCTLDELADNTRRITCGVFKRFALDGSAFDT